MKVIAGVFAVLFLFAAGVAVYFWYTKPPVVSRIEYIKVPEIKVVTKIKRVEVPMEKIVVIEKQVIVEKLKLPDWVKNDTNEQAIATAVIEPYEGETNTVALVNTKSGVGNILAEQQPLSLFAFESKWKVGLDYGLYAKNNSDKFQTGLAADVFGGWELVRIKRCHVGPYVEIMTTGDGKATLRMECR